MTTHQFVGWVRLPRKRWQNVVGADTHDDALAELLIYAEKIIAAHKDLIVLRADDDPNRQPTKVARVTENAIDFTNAEATL